MATKLTYPGALEMSGNIRDILVQSTEEINFEIQEVGVGTILEETYQPNEDELITIRLKDLMPSLFSLDLPTSDVFEQTQSVKNFNFLINGSAVVSKVVLGGVDGSENTTNFLKANWLTWQPQQKNVKFNDPEWLTYHAVVTAVVKVKAYFKDADPETITLTSLPAGKTYSLNMNFGYLSGKFAGQPVYFDVWNEDTVGTQLAFVQRFVLFNDYFEHEDLFVAANSLGGLDTFRFTGEKEESNGFDIESALFDEDTQDYAVEFEKIYKKNTGYFIDDRYRIWAQEFFTSLKRYYCADTGYQSITVSKPKAKSVQGDITTYNYDFEFALSRQTKYLNLSRANELPEVVEIVDPDSELFFLAPRLNEFPSATLTDQLLIPVQVPFAKNWQATSYSAIVSDILAKVAAIGYVPGGEVGEHVDLTPYALKTDLHTHQNKALIDGLSKDGNYLKSDAVEVWVGNADRLGNVAAANYWQKTELVNDALYLKVGGYKIKAGYADLAYDSERLGNRISGDYWHKDNSNLDTIPWAASSLKIGNSTTITKHDSTGILRVQTPTGYTVIGSANATYSHFYTDRAKFYFGRQVVVTDLINIYNTNTSLQNGVLYLNTNDWIKHTDASGQGWEIVTDGAKDVEILRGIGIVNHRNVINKGYVGSQSYESGFGGSGWRVDSTGNGTLDSLTVRKTFNIYELNVQKIRSGNGSYWFSDGMKVNQINNDSTYYRMYIDFEEGNVPFRVGDIIRCQNFNGRNVKYYSLIVNDVYNEATQSYIRCLVSSKVGADIPEIGDEIVRIGNTTDTNRQGAVYITSNDNNAPYIDVLDGVTSDNFTGKQKVRLGKLDGITSPTFGNLSGYGLYTSNGYFEGTVNAKRGNIANFTIDNDNIWAGTSGAGDIEMNQALRRFLVRKDGSNFVNMHYSNTDDWGLLGYNGGNEVFRLGSTNRIFGSLFDYEKLTCGNVQIWKTGDIINTAAGTPYAFYGNGSFSLGKGQIGYNAATNVVTLGAGVKMTWNQITGTEGVETTAGAQAKVDAIRIGGRNLLLKSEFSATSSNEYIKYVNAHEALAANVGNEVTISFDIKCSINQSTTIIIYSSNNRRYSIGATNLTGVTTEYKRMSITATVTDSDPTKTVSYIEFYGVYGSGQILTVKNMKIEAGNKATDWTPAPEDVDVSIATKITSEQATTITENTIKTTNVAAQYLQVQAANITGQLTAAQINFDGATGINMNLTGSLKTTRTGISGVFMETSIEGINIYESYSSDDFGRTEINMKGYAGGYTKFRTTRIGNGKYGELAVFHGQENSVYIRAGRLWANGTFEVDGAATLKAGVSITGEASATTFKENGILLSSKYAAAIHGTHLDSSSLNSTLQLYSSSFGYRNGSNFGWCRLPNGMIMNWGRVSVSANSISQLYYKQPFTTVCVVTSTPEVDFVGGIDATGVTTITNSSFHITNGHGSMLYFNWIAIGY